MTKQDTFRNSKKITSLGSEIHSYSSEGQDVLPTNILMVSDDFLPAATGVGSHLQVITQELVKRGHNIVVLTSRRRGQSEEEMWNGVKVCRLFSIPIAGFYQAIPTAKKIRQVLQENKIELIHHHYLSFLLEKVYNQGRKLKIVQVYTYHMSDSLLSQPIFMRPLRSLIHRRAIAQYNKFDRLISPSRNIADEICRDGITTKIEVIPNPVSMKKMADIVPAEKKGKFQILYAGRLASEKNIPLLLKAFAIFLKKNQQASLWIAGEGGERAALERHCAELKITKSVEFLGQLNHSDLSRCYMGCDVFVLPSVLEVQAIVVIEAMRFAKPVIVTEKISCASELVSEGENGYIVHSTDSSVLAEKLLQLSQSEELRQRMGEASQKRSQEFSPKLIIERLRRIYADVFTTQIWQQTH